MDKRLEAIMRKDERNNILRKALTEWAENEMDTNIVNFLEAKLEELNKERKSYKYEWHATCNKIFEEEK